MLPLTSLLPQPLDELLLTVHSTFERLCPFPRKRRLEAGNLRDAGAYLDVRVDERRRRPWKRQRHRLFNRQ